jgi:hypothetical protein
VKGSFAYLGVRNRPIVNCPTSRQDCRALNGAALIVVPDVHRRRPPLTPDQRDRIAALLGTADSQGYPVPH